MGARLLRLYEAAVLQNPLATVVLVVLFAAILAGGLTNFKIDASADSLTLEHDADLDYFRELAQRYGSSDILVVTFKPRHSDLFSDEALQTLRSLTDDLGKIAGVTNVQSLVNVPLLFSPRIDIRDLKESPRTLLTPGMDREAARREFRESPIYKDLILGPDGQTTGIVALLSSDPQYLEMVRHRDALRKKRDTEGLSAAEKIELKTLSKAFLDYRTEVGVEDYQRVQDVRALMDRYRDRAELFLGGPSMITADMVDYVARDMVVFGSGVVVFILFTMVVIFRQLRWVVLPFISCGLAVVMMLGWLSWIDWRLTVISSNFVSVLLIIAMALTIHLVVRYRELHWRHEGWEQIDLVRETVRTMAQPCFYTVLTTVVAFASLVVSDIRPVIDFGWMMTIGLLLAFVLVFLIIPTGILLWGKLPVRHRASEDAPHTLYFSRFTERHGTWVVVLSLALAGAALFGITRLEVDNRFIDYFRKDTEIYQGLAVIDANLGGTTPLDIVIRKPKAPSSLNISTPSGDVEYGEEGDPFAADDPFAEDGDPFAETGEDGEEDIPSVPSNYWFTRAGLEELAPLHDYLESLSEIGKVNSVVTAFRVANDLTGHTMNDFELTFMRQTLAPEIREFLLAPYLDDANQETRLTMRTVETASDLRRDELLEKIDRFMRDEMDLSPGDYQFSGLLVLYNNLLQSLYQSQILTLGAVFLGIMIMFLVLFRSLALSVIAILPNLLAASVVLGGMGLAGIPLDMMTITIAAITVGIGVDDTIHYIHRFKREFSEDRDYLATMHRAHGSIGKAMYYTSVIIICGFSILTLSTFIPTIYFGLLTGSAMLVALLGALALLPKLILMFKPFGPESAPEPVQQSS